MSFFIKVFCLDAAPALIHKKAPQVEQGFSAVGFG
jgi:hypothetical protein